MLGEQRRAEMLAQIGPVLTVELEEKTGQRWVFVPQPAADFAVLSRACDGMQVGMTPGWFDHAARFEFPPCVRVGGTVHGLSILGVTTRPGMPLRIHATMLRGADALAAELLRRLVRPYEPMFREVRARLDRMAVERDAQRRVAAAIAGITGAAEEADGNEIAITPNVCGVTMSLRVVPGGVVELERTVVTPEQVRAIIAGLRRAERLQPCRRRP